MKSQSSKHDSARQVEGMRMSSRDVQRLLESLEKQPAPPSMSNMRAEERTSEHHVVALLVSFESERHRTVQFQAAARDLSRHGVGFLHSAFVHAGTVCSVVIVSRNRHAVRVRGRVVRCRHIDGQVHEIGVRLDEALDLDKFADTSDPVDPGAGGSGRPPAQADAPPPQDAQASASPRAPDAPPSAAQS